MSTTQYSSYRVSKSKTDKVKLSVQIGYAQNAVTVVRLDNDIIPGDNEDGAFTPEVFTVDVGINAELNGRSLIINSIVQKVNPATDMTSITIDITGGNAEFKNSMTAAVSPQTNTVIYTYYISFYS